MSDTPPAFRVVRGVPTAEELAALVGVLADPHASVRRPRAGDLLVGTQRATRGYVPFLAGFGFAAITVYSGLHVPPRNR